MLYHIKVEGKLDQSWNDWLGDVAIRSEQQADGRLVTTLTVDAVDQAVLFGILDRIRDMNLVFLSATCEPENAR